MGKWVKNTMKKNMLDSMIKFKVFHPKILPTSQT